MTTFSDRGDNFPFHPPCIILLCQTCKKTFCWRYSVEEPNFCPNCGTERTGKPNGQTI